MLLAIMHVLKPIPKQHLVDLCPTQSADLDLLLLSFFSCCTANRSRNRSSLSAAVEDEAALELHKRLESGTNSS